MILDGLVGLEVNDKAVNIPDPPSPHHRIVGVEGVVEALVEPIMCGHVVTGAPPDEGVSAFRVDRSLLEYPFVANPEHG